jgi:hypothetical protein
MIAPDVFEDAEAIRIHGNLDPDGELLANHRYNYLYEVFEVDERQWQDKGYFVPIAQEDMNQNPNLVQNPGF